MNGIFNAFAGVTVVTLVFLYFILSPLVAIMSINTILEQAQVAVHVPHNFWTYLSVYGLMLALKPIFPTASDKQ